MKKIITLFLLFVVHVVNAANCYQFRMNWMTTWSDTPEAAKQAQIAYCLPNMVLCGGGSNSSSYGPWSVKSQVAVSATGGTVSPASGPYFIFHRYTTASHPAGAGIEQEFWGTQNFSSQLNPAGCPNCTAGEKHDVARDAATSVGTTMCGSDSCEYTATRASNFMIAVGNYHYWTEGEKTGNQCTPETPVFTPDPPQSGQSADQHCYTSGGTTACTAPSTTNCGTVNGDQVCATAVAAGECATLGSGAMICGATAALTSPPAPNNGSNTSQPATPTVEYNSSTTTSTNTNNYYSTSIVNNQASGSSSSSSGGGTENGNGEGVVGACANTNCSDVGRGALDSGPFTVTEEQAIASNNAFFGTTMRNGISDMVTTAKTVWPFSVLAAPIIDMPTSTPSPPTLSMSIHGHAITYSLEPWSDVFQWVRAAEGLALIVGFWLVMMGTVTKFTTGGA